MRLALLSLIAVTLVGCTTVPVARKFPEAPQTLMEKCPELKKLAEDAKIGRAHV